ncbi:DUF1048 domain-containing protein [Kineococcus sp. T13]|uniref:DUF1048 domain-containing protein n=1 Tax=Kineococcus vitellinus TaxID=2696565 RepID=UPI001412578A|nr:DUF1048 domain-containing protein [Kineococcus vitellinus]NAZ76526.1 DUF1048 domain-containing protein [Kineococcus vitellinus]
MSAFIEKVVGDIGDKKRWREHEVRVRALPSGYRSAVEALERYLLRRGVIAKGDVLVDLHVELVEVFERAASQGTPVSEVVGGDPVHFADTLLGKYAAGEWIDEERRRLVSAIADAEAENGSRS